MEPAVGFENALCTLYLGWNHKGMWEDSNQTCTTRKIPLNIIDNNRTMQIMLCPPTLKIRK